MIKSLALCEEYKYGLQYEYSMSFVSSFIYCGWETGQEAQAGTGAWRGEELRRTLRCTRAHYGLLRTWRRPI
jgi:hypothetical protein